MNSGSVFVSFASFRDNNDDGNLCCCLAGDGHGPRVDELLG